MDLPGGVVLATMILMGHKITKETSIVASG
jgi:hypothetical protein